MKPRNQRKFSPSKNLGYTVVHARHFQNFSTGWPENFVQQDIIIEMAAKQEPQWMAQPQAPLGCPPGLEYLTQIDQLLVQQQVELLESSLICVMSL